MEMHFISLLLLLHPNKTNEYAINRVGLVVMCTATDLFENYCIWYFNYVCTTCENENNGFECVELKIKIGFQL